MPRLLQNLALIALSLTTLIACTQAEPSPSPTPQPAALRAGLRASDYGIEPWPSPQWWGESLESMAGRFPDADGAIILIVVTTAGARGCVAHFVNPTPETETPGVVYFEAGYEDLLTSFDERGIQVWLQVEPGTCDMEMLIDLVMQRYGHHPSVIGFGVDVEWYGPSEDPEGYPVTDEEAQAWVEATRAYNPGYQVFLKHWLPEKLPPTARDGLVFIDDSQQFESVDQMLDEFAVWGEHFTPAPVGFQYGYPADQKWWDDFDDPPGDIGSAILERVPNTADLYWVDFTAYQIWPRK
jgi:hypothetical protein